MSLKRSEKTFVVAVAMLAMAPIRADATVCSHRIVSAEGAAAVLTITAKSRAKAAWRVAVGATPGLGPDYAVWGIAVGRSFACRPVLPLRGLFGEQVCTATASPCTFD